MVLMSVCNDKPAILVNIYVRPNQENSYKNKLAFLLTDNSMH